MTPNDQNKVSLPSQNEADGKESSISEEELYLMEHAYA